MPEKFEAPAEFTKQLQAIEEKYAREMAEIGDAILKAVADGGEALIQLPEAIEKGRKLEQEAVQAELDEDEITALRKKIGQL